MRIIVLALMVLSYLKTNSQIHHDFSDKLTEYIAIQHKRLGFNGIVLVANNKEILFEKAIGHASHELEVPITMESKFKIASISKSFTGMLLAIAIQEEKIGLDDTIKSFFSDYVLNEAWNDITVRHLISHTSGIPHWKGYKDYWLIKSRFPLNTEQVLTDIFSMDLRFKPGDGVHYSSPAFYVLAAIIEAVYADSYANILETKIFNPLHLNDTKVFEESKITRDMTSGYHITPSKDLIPAPYRNMSALKGAGNMISSAYDLLKWNRSMMDSGTWDTSLVQSLFKTTTDNPMPHNNNAGYGMGWYIHYKRTDNLKAYQVAGGTFGYSCISAIYPEKELSIIILSNVSFLPVSDLWTDVEAIVFDQPFELPVIRKIKTMSLGQMEELIGIYRASNGMQLEIKIHQNKLFAILQNKPPFQILAENDYTFFSDKIGVRLIFETSRLGLISGIKAERQGTVYKFKKE